ncbi:MAG: YtxH domain-containing protein [Eggerthellaceae bacterium]|nr:YtxH domain-containing protein [Eggerthellaceae bacterium]
MAGRLIPFIVGGIVGAATALLYAPKTGEETRAYVADKANEAWGSAQNAGSDAQSRGQQFYGGAVAKGQEMYANVAEQAQQAYTRAAATAQDVFGAAQARVQEATTNSAPFATTQNDELREKIEAARQRIAAQVAKNAEGVQNAAAQIEVEAQAVVDAAADAK